MSPKNGPKGERPVLLRSDAPLESEGFVFYPHPSGWGGWAVCRKCGEEFDPADHMTELRGSVVAVVCPGCGREE